MLELVTGAQMGPNNRGTIAKQLCSNRAELFTGITGTTHTVAEFWLEANEKILDDMECTPKQKLRGTVSLLCDEACCWWQAVVRGTQAERLTWEYFLEAFQKKYVGAKYVKARCLEFIELRQGDKTVAEFLRLSHCASGMVAEE